MTSEIVELEFAHILLDQKLRGGNTEQFEDPAYKDYDEETEEETPDYLLPVETDAGWEDVEEDEIY